MKVYTCSTCNNLVYFENNICLSCGHTLGFDADQLELVALTVESEQSVYLAVSSGARYRLCENASYGTCNWLIPIQYSNTLCLACLLNRTIPSLRDKNLERWKRIETAKHRLVYSLLRLNLPLTGKDGHNTGLAFDFLADVSPDKRVMTGHDNGVITLNIEEADEAERVRNKLDLGEKYRTLLGHFRHEIGHYYWDVIVKNQPARNGFQQLFGNDTLDYTDAIQRYYVNGAPPDWANHFISPYASSHPWEDWAESWSHYMHMMDTLETAYYFGLHVNPEKQTGVKNLQMESNRDPYTIQNFNAIVQRWLPLTFAVNSLNRSMGHTDFYPFVIAPDVVQKLAFIHALCMEQR